MPDLELDYEAKRSLARIRPKILAKIEASSESRYTNAQLTEMIDARLLEHWPRLFRLLLQLYGQHYDFFYYLENILLTAIDCWLSRPDELYQLDDWSPGLA